jgi:Bacterial regulatory proteins, tetR family
VGSADFTLPSTLKTSSSTKPSRRGFETATINEVAQLAGVSAPLVYALFKSKEGLLRALIESTVFGICWAQLPPGLASVSPKRATSSGASRAERSIGCWSWSGSGAPTIMKHGSGLS